MRTWTVEEIRNLINTNDKFIGTAIVKIFEQQTIDEQSCDETQENNGVGFNGVDAPILSSFAKFYMKNGYLSTKQIAIARKKMPKYSKQVCGLANAWELAKG